MAANIMQSRLSHSRMPMAQNKGTCPHDGRASTDQCGDLRVPKGPRGEKPDEWAFSCGALRGLFWTVRGEIAVQLRDDGRPFANGAADSLDRARPCVAHGEHARHIRFKRQRTTPVPSCVGGLGLRAR